MTTLNQGRNDIRFNNSGGRCLLENWVEERAVSDIDPPNLNNGGVSGAQVFKAGHKGLLSTDLESSPEKLTTIKDSYRPPRPPNVRQTGIKKEFLERMLYEQVSKEVEDEFNQPPEDGAKDSVYHSDYHIEGFVPTAIPATAPHDYVNEAPVSFWTEHKEKLHGVSQMKTLDTPFRKNTSFSKPISESVDQAQPYEMENIPKM